MKTHVSINIHAREDFSAKANQAPSFGTCSQHVWIDMGEATLFFRSAAQVEDLMSALVEALGMFPPVEIPAEAFGYASAEGDDDVPF